MNFAAFQHSRRWSNDIAKDLGCDTGGDVCGLIYLDSLYIGVSTKHKRVYHLILGNQEWAGTGPAELADLEHKLFAYWREENGVNELYALADAAKKLPHGSAAQISCENEFYIKLQDLISPEDFEAVEEYNMNGGDGVEFGLDRFNNPRF